MKIKPLFVALALVFSLAVVSGQQAIYFPPTSGGGGGGGGSAWTLVESRACTGNATESFLALDAYSEIKVVLEGVQLSASAWTTLRVSVNNGASYLTAYKQINTRGAVFSTITSVDFVELPSPDPRWAVINVTLASTASPVKLIETWTTDVDLGGSNYVTTFMVENMAPINAVRVLTTGGTTLVAGTIHLFGR